MQGVYIFPKRKSLLAKSLQNYPLQHWQQLLQQLWQVDKTSKGIEQGDPWELMQLVLAAIAGKTYL